MNLRSYDIALHMWWSLFRVYQRAIVYARNHVSFTSILATIFEWITANHSMYHSHCFSNDFLQTKAIQSAWLIKLHELFYDVLNTKCVLWSVFCEIKMFINRWLLYFLSYFICVLYIRVRFESHLCYYPSSNQQQVRNAICTFPRLTRNYVVALSMQVFYVNRFTYYLL